ncbi:MAG: sensor domain-containing diguanylate cyclase [Terriglobales bacterium]
MDAPRPQRARRRGLGYILLTVPLLLGGFPLHNSAWRGAPYLHTRVETISAILGLVIGVQALIRYYAKKSSTFLFLGTGFLGAAVLDTCHALVTSSSVFSNIPASLSDLPPWSGIMSSIFISVLMCASLIAWQREMSQATEIGMKDNLVYLLVGIWFVVTFLFFALLEVPPPFHPDHLIHRPADFVPSFFFAFAAIGYLRKGWWKSDDFEHWLVISLIFYGVSRLGYFSFYEHTFDAQYFVGHAFKILGHITMLTGLFVSMFSIFKSEAKSASDLLHANCMLATQLEVERRLVSNLKETEYRASHDFLTGIHNRSGIMDLLKREASRCKRTHQQMGLLIVDIDHFKAVNDTYGHPVGDEVIKQLALKIAAALRPYDSVGRLGGEEFLVLLPSCALSEAAAVAERLRLSVGADKLVVGQLTIPVTVSVGVSTLEGPAADVEAALQTADSALYAAKNNGRNRVEIYDPASVAASPIA